MRDVLAEIDRWREAGEPVALATVVETWGSAPRAASSRMAVTASGKIAGSVSGGCVEGAVVEASAEVLRTGRPRLLRFGVSDETAWSVGLSCGGTIEVFVEPLDAAAYEPLREAILAGRPAAAATIVRGPNALLGRKLLLLPGGETRGSPGAELDPPLREAARAALEEGRSRKIALSAPEPVEVFVEVLRPAPTLVIVGGVHIAIALAAIAKALGYRTIVVDPRARFGSAERFPHADRLVQAWPDDALAKIGLAADTAVAVLTHDPKLDDPALRAALPSAAFYVGALGSKATQAKRRQRLLGEGLTEAHLARLHAPIGLDLGGRAPEEIALSVMAQIVVVRHGRERGAGSPEATTGQRG
jgi:xanthine dehydrogenase accessory factor